MPQPLPSALKPVARARSYRRRRRSDERVRILGGPMDLVKSAEVFHFVAQRIAAGRRTVIANHNLHSLSLARKSDELRDFFDRADLIEVDSAPLLAWARLVAGRSRGFHRCTYLDWRAEFWSAAAANQWRVFLVGGAPGVVEAAMRRLRAEWPGLCVDGRHGYFDDDPSSDENAEVVAAVNAARPQVLLIGMGMPRQELWINRNERRLPASVMFTVGGAFDYEAGVQTPCPRWIGRIGLEWLFRLAMNPPRLFWRYCVEPWSLLGPALEDLARLAGGRSKAE